MLLLPEYLKDFTRWAYVTGWRAGSIKSLRWSEVDGDTISVRAQYSKNREAIKVPIVGPLRLIVARRQADREGDYVFHYPDGRPIGNYKIAWRTATKKAGLAGKMFHDLRRTAATNLRRSGVAENVAMQITGHKTRSMFDRYDIRSTEDVRAALVQREQWELGEQQRQLTPVTEKVQ